MMVGMSDAFITGLFLSLGTASGIILVFAVLHTAFRIWVYFCKRRYK